MTLAIQLSSKTRETKRVAVNESSIASVVAALTLTLRVNWPLISYSLMIYFALLLKAVMVQPHAVPK